VCIDCGPRLEAHAAVVVAGCGGDEKVGVGHGEEDVDGLG
jgi:hypothetical protein